MPDRGADEENITSNQFNYIARLVKDMDHAELRELGKWQASSLIDQLKKAKGDFTDDLIDEAVAAQKKPLLVKVIIVIFIVFVALSLLE